MSKIVRARLSPKEGELANVARISYFKEVESKPQSNEFVIEGAGFESADAALHESLLQNESAAARSDIAAVQAAISMGIPIETALRHFAGDLARSQLIAAGLLKK